ncbi:MAG: NF038122 family metalloprotease, partial [Caulobacterales bacterium]
MTLPSESVTLAGSGLVFVNSYGAGATDTFRGEVLAAETFFQGHFTDSLTVNASFDLQGLDPAFTARNAFSIVKVSYGQFTEALQAHAMTADDRLAVAGLPATDPSNGTGFNLPTTYATLLGLTPQTNALSLRVMLNNDGPLSQADAIGALEHEISEAAFGRDASLGFYDSAGWEPLDLFRFTGAGQRDFTGGADGVATFFGLDSSHVTTFGFHNAVNAAGVADGFDLGDWSFSGDAFGVIGPGAVGPVSVTDLRVLDVLGATPTGAGPGFTPAADDFANSLTDTSHPFGQVTVGGFADGALQVAGDRDWFAVQLQAGTSYTIGLVGHQGGGGTLADPMLRLHDAGGAVVAANDDVVAGANPDSQLVFVAPASGTYYAEAGASLDGYTGTYRLEVAQTGAAPGGQVINGAPGGDTIQAPDTNDTISGGSGGANYLRGNGGDDSITGGSGFDDINGNMGNDTLHGGAGDDWVVGGKDNDLVFGDDGDDIVLGNLGNDTLDGGNGADVVRGG